MGELFRDFSVFEAFKVTLQLAGLSAFFAFSLGLILAIFRISPIPTLRFVGASYVNLVRSIPLTLIIIGTNLGLALELGLQLAGNDSPTYIVDQNFRLAVLGLSLYHASLFCEALRSGFNTIGRGQVEASRAIGLNFNQTLRFVILPQSLRGAITPLGNVLIALTRNTTVASAIGVLEASSLMKTMIEQRPDIILSIFGLIAGGFILLTLPAGICFTWLSRKFAVNT